MALIYTAELHDENPFEYLVALLAHPADVAADPAAWLPWTFAPRSLARRPQLRNRESREPRDTPRDEDALV